jgi:putative transcriptional regulator
MEAVTESGNLKGRLLVALPPLVDENFDRTVVLLLEHGDGGALGVVLNRPSRRAVDDLLSPWSSRTVEPAVFFEGGPVETESIIGVATCAGRGASDDEAAAHWAPIVDGIGTVDLSVPPDEHDPPIDTLRLFVGYAGWAPSQLEGELQAGAWLVVDFDPHDVFATEPLALWRRVLRRQGGRLAWMANYPDELARN